MSTGSEMENNDGNGADTFNTPCPEGSVPLHQVCDNCQHFFDTWKAFDMVANWNKALLKIPQEKFELCTVAYLLQSKQTCHFCSMLLSRLKDPDRAQHVMLYAHGDLYDPERDDEESDYMGVTVAVSRNSQRYDFPLLYIKAFNCESYTNH
jgi:hypothetical protein